MCESMFVESYAPPPTRRLCAILACHEVAGAPSKAKTTFTHKGRHDGEWGAIEFGREADPRNRAELVPMIWPHLGERNLSENLVRLWSASQASTFARARKFGNLTPRAELLLRRARVAVIEMRPSDLPESAISVRGVLSLRDLHFAQWALPSNFMGRQPLHEVEASSVTRRG